ncbi:MAG: hypothetical protein H7X80_06495, partial [bacterium]|nr:hypothetical protein [Candidatus Kapabacteria bacterium]
LETRVHEGNFTIVSSGHAGVAHAIQHARTQLSDGRWERCVVVAVDSLVETTALSRIDAQKRLKADDNPVGLRPGEAGGFLLIERALDAEKRGANILGVISDVSTGFDSNHLESQNPGVGQGMAETLGGLRALNTIQQAPVLVVDLNGEVFRSRDFGFTLQRTAMSLPQLRDAGSTYPATAFGDTGAVSGLIGICMAISGMQRDYWGSEHALILSSSDSGARGGVLASRYTKEVIAQ